MNHVERQGISYSGNILRTLRGEVYREELWRRQGTSHNQDILGAFEDKYEFSFNGCHEVGLSTYVEVVQIPYKLAYSVEVVITGEVIGGDHLWR